MLQGLPNEQTSWYKLALSSTKDIYIILKKKKLCFGLTRNAVLSHYNVQPVDTV